MSREAGSLPLVLAGGGARAAYQVGVLRGFARHFPDVEFDIITGVSAGAINALFLAAHDGPLLEAADRLSEVWGKLHLEDVVQIDPPSLARNLLAWGAKLASGGDPVPPRVPGLG